MERDASERLSLSVYCLNPALFDKDIYIMGIDSDDFNLFLSLTTENVPIAGFVSEKLKGGVLFNRNVFDFDSIDQTKAVFLTSSANMAKEEAACICYEEVFVINPLLNDTEIYIYGAGEKGKNLYNVLLSNGIDIKCFIDSDYRKQGLMYEGKEICDINVLEAIGKNSIVIASGKNACEIRDNVNHKFPELTCVVFFDFPLEQGRLWVDRCREIEIKPGTIAWLQENCSGKEIILFGKEIFLLERYKTILNTLGFLKVSMATDHVDNRTMQIEEILYKTDYYLLICDEESLNERRWNLLCVPQGRLYNLIGGVQYIGECVIDTAIGHTYFRNSNIPGFQIHETDCLDAFDIVVLGGSTTDWVCKEWGITSWPELMFEKYKNYNIRVWNGGIVGYDSSQEWVKFYRDVLKMRPNMVIVYDGYNDTTSHPGRTSFSYLETLITDASKRVKRYSFMEQPKEVWNGLKSRGDVVDVWLENIEMMHSLARDRGISLHVFIQPMLMSKLKMDLHSLSLSLMYQLNAPWGNEYKNNAILFRERAPKITKEHPYIHDLSSIFDEEDVYMDTCHVYERGNEIIADAIWNYVRDSVCSERSKK